MFASQRFVCTLILLLCKFLSHLPAFAQVSHTVRRIPNSARYSNRRISNPPAATQVNVETLLRRLQCRMSLTVERVEHNLHQNCKPHAESYRNQMQSRIALLQQNAQIYSHSGTNPPTASYVVDAINRVDSQCRPYVVNDGPQSEQSRALSISLSFLRSSATTVQDVNRVYDIVVVRRVIEENMRRTHQALQSFRSDSVSSRSGATAEPEGCKQALESLSCSLENTLSTEDTVNYRRLFVSGQTPGRPVSIDSFGAP